jgi:hypothetical protein
LPRRDAQEKNRLDRCIHGLVAPLIARDAVMGLEVLTWIRNEPTLENMGVISSHHPTERPLLRNHAL